MDTGSSLPQDGLFGELLMGRLEGSADIRIDLNGGAKMRFKDFGPNAVMLFSPSLDEWLPEGHLARFIAELVEHEMDLGLFYAS
ncbi:hypothetical protein GCM10009715_08600 [Paeniglutamicibacter psychrophenolicus]|uniref:Uncharacterized protein n=1 Tax=Paeniglutamicibacter psychrophenolicus TaxID=257454 RepID=A0ABS4WHC0_9MICC|nr:hypothetical protein [Paeniglutamicibacter psychrophenolicus]MBP2374964.1 hypothetical protein [Paeniglutamicibacter psychrophenolicus]